MVAKEPVSFPFLHRRHCLLSEDYNTLQPRGFQGRGAKGISFRLDRNEFLLHRHLAAHISRVLCFLQFDSHCAAEWIRRVVPMLMLYNEQMLEGKD